MSVKAMRAGVNLRVRRLLALRYRRRAAAAWGWSEDQYAAYQRQAFERIYRFARARVPYYGAYPELAAGTELSSALRALPLLPKATVRERNREFWATPPLPLTQHHTTSGTSGTPLVLAATMWEKAFFQAIREEWFHRAAGARAPRTLFLSGFMTPGPEGGELAWTDPLSGDTYLSIYSLNERNRPRVLEILDRVRPGLVYGYASAVRELAVLLGERPASMRGARAAVVTSEVLQPHWREVIERNLCDRVLDFYSSQEGCHAAMECPAGRLHVHPMMGVVEVLDDDGAPAAPGEIGRVVVTGLLRRSMPLIRYELGDSAAAPDPGARCECGLGWPLVGAVDGRSEDLVVTRDGSRVGYLCFHATKNLSGIREAQIVQRGFEDFVCNLVLAGDFAGDRAGLERRIQEQMVLRLQHPVTVDFRYLEQIPRGGRGKFKAVVVDFDQGSPPRQARGPAPLLQ
ncbi:MAG TPA: hypothetical protein VHG51_14510 [Longimicrobiaceae bacterium]|nr:hypothetical protein [Longimicrobiaceae bacterium]